MDQNYKARKEAFVSGHLGGSINEINAVTLVAPVSSTCSPPVDMPS
jgi:phosphatidylinositol glycan class W